MTSPRYLCPFLFVLAVLTGCSERTLPPLTFGDDLRVLAAQPLVGRPTDTTVTLKLNNGAVPAAVELRLPDGTTIAVELSAGEVRDLVVDGLGEGMETSYVLTARASEVADRVEGRFRTRPPPGSEFSFAVLSDTHLPVPALEWLADDEEARQALLEFSLFRAEVGATIRLTLDEVRRQDTDFVISLGDMFTIQDAEFNPPFRAAVLAEAAYLDFRGHLGRTTSEAAFFAVVGNWDGENGWHPEELRTHGRAARQRHLLNPTPSTYAQGGGEAGDYYAWAWGDALFVVLNVMSYTTTVHTLDDADDGTATSWTLGEAQWAWLEPALRNAQETWKFLFIHHTVGGNGGDERNSAYGRGGGRAARVGEQQRLHELMVSTGVQVFFYGHDHVFTDQVVDGVHYVLPGSAGAPWKFETYETGYEDFDPRSGFAVVRVGRSAAEIAFHGLDGEVFRTIHVDP